MRGPSLDADRFDVAIVGSGFAGSILARCLHRQGKRVVLIERNRHPRFTLGESSTPLAAIALERLANRYELSDLLDLASYGRWMNHQPEIRRGLKRGFTFYGHGAHENYENDASNSARLLVAASPDDEIADSHWLRADVDAALVQRAVSEGVTYLEETAVSAVEMRDDSVRLRLRTLEEHRQLTASFVVDATGGPGLPGLDTKEVEIPFSSRLVGGHFRKVRELSEVTPEASFGDGPYPDAFAAVHHWTDVGWMYELRFDHGVTSAGFVVERERAEAAGLGNHQSPESLWRELLVRYPALAEQFANSELQGRWLFSARLQRRAARAVGPRWARLPHSYAFFDPLFSTGIAWSLVGVERLAQTLGNDERDAESLQRYQDLLAHEADHVSRLIGGAYRRFGDFESFCRHTQLYFAAASYSEVRQRLLEPPEALDSWAQSGFLGADDPLLSRLVAEAESGGDVTPEALAPRNLAGLAQPTNRNLYAVDLEQLVRSAALIGLSPDQVRDRLPLLRGGGLSSH